VTTWDIPRLELLLLSLSSCLGSATLTFLRRMGKTITNFEIRSKGLRKQEHPTGLSHIIMEMDITAGNRPSRLTVDKVRERSPKLPTARSGRMLRGNVIVEVNV